MDIAHDAACQLEGLHVNADRKNAQVLLFSSARGSPGRDVARDIPDIEALCPGLLKIELVSQKGPLKAVVLFRSWNFAAKAVVGLWKIRLQGVHSLTPQLLEDDSDDGAFTEYVDRELTTVFLHHLDDLERGETVVKLQSDIDNLKKEISSIENKLKQKNSIDLFNHLVNLKKDLANQLEALAELLAEYFIALSAFKESILSWGAEGREECCHETKYIGTFVRLENSCSWHHLHCTLERETLRLKERLPVYGKRHDILQHLGNNQVVVLSGDTGSGKSTQLVQYIVDAGFVKDGSSVACTQPRKVAVTALSNRVTEECRGCTLHEPLVGSLVSGWQRQDSYPKILFATDSSLLQLCLVDELLSQFDCVLVDEVHERSLSTDLLLAMLKQCVARRPDFKVFILSATVDTELISAYFDGCAMYHIPGRRYPIEVIYLTEDDDGRTIDSSYSFSGVEPHVLRVMKAVNTILSRSDEGDVLAFLTSQAEIEWACSQQYESNTIILPLHGRLQASEQQRVFTTSSSKRKIVFATNVAETSLTIPGIKFVVDCGLSKESCVDPKTGMTILKVCRIHKGAALQRAGRAGRTQPGICYRLYSEMDFESMVQHRVPEILRVHLGVAVLKLAALGAKNFEKFDFIESPSPAAISLAVENLSQLGAVATIEGKVQLTSLGWKMVKLGADPYLGFIVLTSISEGLGGEGVIIAGLLSCSGSIFFRSGLEEDKLRSDRLKMRFCHADGDIFTLLSVYQEWASIPKFSQNKWCVQNSINAKSMRKCEDFIQDLKHSLKREFGIELSYHGVLSKLDGEKHWSEILRKILISAMPRNIAVFSGHESTGYDVISVGKQAYLHPSSSCLVFGQSPNWVVFGNLLSTSRQFLTSITVVEPEWLSEINLGPFDIQTLESRRMIKVTIPGLCRTLLTRVCGKGNKYLKLLSSKICRKTCERCCLEADYEKGEISIFTTGNLMERAKQLMEEAISQVRKWLNSESLEKSIFRAFPGRSSPAILFGAGAEIKEVLMPGEFATVEVLNVDAEIEDQEVVKLFDVCVDGVAGFRKNTLVANSRKWGTVTFNSRKGAAEAITLIHNAKFGRQHVEVRPVFTYNPHEGSRSFVPVVKATLTWPRREPSGLAVACCKSELDCRLVVSRCYGLVVCGSQILCKPDRKGSHTEAFVFGVGNDVTKTELLQALQQASGCILENVRLIRHPAKDQPSVQACREALEQEIQHFVPLAKFELTIHGQQGDHFTRAVVSFDESVHESAARAVAYLEGRTLPICKSWQIISCENAFLSYVSCSRAIYSVLKEEFEKLIAMLTKQTQEVELTLTTNEVNAGCHVKIAARSLRTAAACKSAFENLLEGTVFGNGHVEDLGHLFSKQGLQIIRSVELQTRTLIVCCKRSRVIKIYGSAERRDRAHKSLLRNLSQLREKKNCHEIELRGGDIPCGLMRELVKEFGIDLHGLKVLCGGASLNLDQRRHILLVHGSRENMVQVHEKIQEIESSLMGPQCQRPMVSVDFETCSICFCEQEDKYNLAGCGHGFCRACIREQIFSSIRHREGFPLKCAFPGCAQKLLLVDFEAILSADQEVELQRASLCAYVASSKGKYKFCVTADCPSVYRASEKSKLFTCGACAIRLCMSCNREFHLGLTCTEYEEFKKDPDLSLKSWRHGKHHVKCCPSCGSTIEKVDGCNHVLCNCKAHLCWMCLASFRSSEDCYSHLQIIHGGYT